MGSYKVLAAATCLILGAVVANAMPGGKAESYQEFNLDSYGGYSSYEPKYEIKYEKKEEPKYEIKYEEKKEEPKYEIYADSKPKYSFKYGVEDKHTGDYKDQKEERDEDVVKGEYSLLQPDGRKRIVYYTASKHGGFNAQVSYSGHAIHPETYEKKEEPKYEIKYEKKEEPKYEFTYEKKEEPKYEISYEKKEEPKYEIYADSKPKYSFKYGVEDKHTGDYKDQKEERDEDIVKGEYSLLQPDGRKRIVYYTASKHGGFNAQVSYSGHAIHPETYKKEEKSYY